MEAILDEIRATLNCGIWYPVITNTLMLPDACGAVEYCGQNKRPRERYISWYDKWVLPHFSPDIIKFDGEVVYIVRNALIHESTGFTRGEHGFDRILFTPPNGNMKMHFNLHKNSSVTDEVAFLVSISEMLDAVERGVRSWLFELKQDPSEKRRLSLDKLIQLRPLGVDPFIYGVPIVS